MAMQELRARSWFPKSVRDIRAFRIEQWSDFTSVVKGARPSRPLEVREPEVVYAA
jgi:virulence-associated protein VapD